VADPRGQQGEQGDAGCQHHGRDAGRGDRVEHGERHESGHTKILEKAGADVAERFGARVDANPGAGLDDVRGERRPAAKRGSGESRGRGSMRLLGHDGADRAADHRPQERVNDVPHRVQHRDLAHHELADVQHGRGRQNRRALQHRRYRGDVPEPAQQAEHEHRRVAIDAAGDAAGEDQGHGEHPLHSTSRGSPPRT
jgi:hypothetical protein